MLGVVIGLLLLGVLLLLLEIVFVPGTTVVGIGGLLLLAIGIYLAYSRVSVTAGHIGLVASVLAVFIALVILLKTDTWKRVALNDQLQGKGTVSVEEMVKIGDRGRTISRLNPVGKAMFHENLIIEVATNGDLVNEDTEVEVIKTEGNRIIVKPFNLT